MSLSDNLVAHIGLLFNMCYHDLVNLLSESTGGICINGFSYYVFCHADDLLFTSLTETGFKKLTRLLGRPQPQMYPPIALNQYTLVNRTHKHYICFKAPQTS